MVRKSYSTEEKRNTMTVGENRRSAWEGNDGWQCTKEAVNLGNVE